MAAEGAILIEASTGQVLYEKNATTRFYPASTTKVLTTLILAEDHELESDVLITKSLDSVNVVPGDSSHIGLYVGDQYTFKDGLYAILLRSDNFVCHDMALYDSGSIEAFAEKMNARARAAGAFSSNFVNPHGYHDPEHYTTPYDLALITRAAFANPIIAHIAGTYSYTLDIVNTGVSVPMLNTARFFNPATDYYNTHVVAAKTGYHTPAGRTLVAKGVYDEIELIAVVLRSGTPVFFEDINKLLAYGSSNFKTSESPTGIVTLENISYSPWAKRYIDYALERGTYVFNTKLYTSTLNTNDFYTMLERFLDYTPLNSPVLSTLRTAPLLPFTPLDLAKVQNTLATVALANHVSLPANFVSTILANLYPTSPATLTVQDALYLQQHFLYYILQQKSGMGHFFCKLL